MDTKTFDELPLVEDPMSTAVVVGLDPDGHPGQTVRIPLAPILESAERAEAAASTAEDWAVKEDGPVEAGQYSAKYHASSAAASAAAVAYAIPTALPSWALVQAFQLVSATRDSNGAITTASIVWPDGATGTFTADTISTAFPGAIDAWHATYSGPLGNKTVTQPAVTRDSNGAVTAQPAITIA